MARRHIKSSIGYNESKAIAIIAAVKDFNVKQLDKWLENKINDKQLIELIKIEPVFEMIE